MLNQILKFAKERDWLQFHTPRNLAESISIEAAELLELYQWWKEPEDENVKEEIADILIYCYQLCNVKGWKPHNLIAKKLKENAKKYPVEKSKGNSKKYNQLDL